MELGGAGLSRVELDEWLGYQGVGLDVGAGLSRGVELERRDN